MTGLGPKRGGSLSTELDLGLDLKDEEQQEESESESESESKSGSLFKELLAIQMVAMETCINSLELFAQKIPSDKKLATTVQKFRAVFDDYKKFPGSSAAEPSISASTCSHSQKRGGETNDEQDNDDDYEDEKPSEIQQLDVESSDDSIISTLAEIEFPISRPAPEPAPMVLDSDFIEIPSKYHYDFDTTPEEERIVIHHELKEYLSHYGEISNILVNSHLDIQILTRLEILGENVKRIKINLWTLDSSFYSSVLDKVLNKCPNLNFLDFKTKEKTKREEEEREEDAKSLFALFLIKAVNKYESEKKEKENPLTLTISELDVDYDKCRNWDTEGYQKFGGSGVRVNRLRIYGHFLLFRHVQDLVEGTTRIFHSSQDSMTRFSYHNENAGVWNKIKFPIMPKLHTLDLFVQILEEPENFFHPDFQFSKHVPNLKTLLLNLNVHKIVEKIWVSSCLGPDSGPAPSVTTLHFNDRGGVYDLESVLQVFPELEELSLPWRKYSNQQPIWKCCTKLKRLTLYSIKMESRKSLVSVLAQLTGFRVEDLEQLWDQNQNQNSEKAVVDSKPMRRIGPSISALQDLETLTLKSECSYSFGKSKAQFSSVVHKLTAESMPKLGEIYIK